MATTAELKDRMATELKAARVIATKADSEGRDLTQSEIDRANTHLRAHADAKAELTLATSNFAKSEEIAQKLADIGLDLGMGGSHRSTQLVKASEQWGEKVRSELEKRAGEHGAKALIGGSIDIPSVVSEPVTISGRPTSLLDLIPRRPRTQTADPNGNIGNTFSYLVQTARSLNARGVPDGAEKPVSDITFEDREDRYRVYATVTDPMPKRFLDDYAQIIEILKAQLGEGLLESLESDILNGTGAPTATADPVKGILQTSGHLAQVYVASVLQTLSNARYTLTDTNVTPNAWVMNSRDLQALELMREGGTTGPLLFGSGRSDIEKVLGEYPIVTSSLISQGTALLGDFNQTELIVREDDHLDIDGSGILFTKNQVRFRHEGRYGFAVNKPSAFITVNLTP
ncbi:phage major capsid protein [Mycetocola manganoxydans]|uniref:Phage major capsid protein n=1 Tax=Mycetocola manganoxydans TaxID=699879 RepID=A0A3L6ZMY8_9MICO|nr:phage major capsid protein [Mycetocola manganoxydans]RLP69396.1 phage major capsid protein [Mycetocola manganoxydans]GHD50715.1 hypothetical protein GCM10008097_24990 [Mycetocola manganoxydans]